MHRTVTYVVEGILRRGGRPTLRDFIYFDYTKFSKTIPLIKVRRRPVRWIIEVDPRPKFGRHPEFGRTEFARKRRCT